MMEQEQEPKTLESSAADFDVAMNALSETIGYLRQGPRPFIGLSYPHFYADRLEHARNSLWEMFRGELCAEFHKVSTEMERLWKTLVVYGSDPDDDTSLAREEAEEYMSQ